MEQEVIIVGGSYAGLSAAMQLARARRRVLILDTGKPRNRFAKASHGFFGQDGRPPQDMIENARRQVLAYPTVRLERMEATYAIKDNDGFVVTLSDGQQVWAKRLILATGVTDQLPDIPGLKELWGTGVAHCPYCHGYEVADRKIVVLYHHSPAAAVHQALLLRDWSSDVTLMTNGMDDLPENDMDRLRDRGVKIVNGRVSRLIAAHDDLQAVEIEDGRQLPCDAMFTAPRWSLTSALAEQLGCEIEEGVLGPTVKTDAFKESSVAGVYVVGDASRAMHNATMASADGVTAGAASHQSLLFPKKPA